MSTTYILTFIQCIVLNLGEINRIPEIHAKIYTAKYLILKIDKSPPSQH